MSEVATAELGLALTDATDNNGGGFNVFSSLRGGAGGEDFSSGTDDISSEEVSVGTDETANLDLVAVAGGEAKLDTSIGDGGDSKNAPAPVDALSLAGKSEINSPENRMSNANSQDNSETLTPVNPELCEKFGTIACIGCDFALLCAERQAAMAAKSNEDQPDKQLSTLEKLLQEDKAPGEIVWAQPTPDDDVSREQLLAVNEEQSLIDDSPSIFKSESEPEPKPKPRPKSEPEPEPEGQTLSDTQPSPRLSNKQKESAAVALSQAAESRSSKSLNHEVDRRHSNDEEKSTTAHIANVVKKTTISDDGGANLEANSNSAAKASKEPLAQIYSDNTNEYTRQDELPRVVDRTADDSGKLVNQQTATVNRVAQTTQRSNKHADQEVSSAVNTTEQISSVNTHQAIQIPEPEDTGSTVATTRSQKEPAIEKVSSTPIDANDTLADSGTSTAIDREYSTQEPPALKLKSISTKNNLLKKTTPKNITTKPKSDSSTDFEVSAEMSLESQKTPSIDKQNPLADDKKDNISSPSAVESVDYSRKTLPETRLVNDVQNTSDGEDSAVKLVEKESTPSKKAVVKNPNIHYSDSAFNQTKQVETVANTPAVKLPAETASWASENEIFVVDREESFANNHRDESMQREVVPIDGGNDLPTLPQNELTPKVNVKQDPELKNTTEINIQLRSDRSSELLPKLDEMVNSVLPPSRSLNYELLPKPDETSSGLQEHDERQISELWPKPDEASNRLIDQADFEYDKPVRQKAQQTRITQPNENDTIYVDLRNEYANSEVDSLHSQPTADYTDQIEMNNDNDLNCQLNDNSGNQAEKLHKVAFAHPLAALWTDDSRLNPENNKISKGSSTSVTSWLTKLVGAVAVYVACSRRESTLGISN